MHFTPGERTQYLRTSVERVGKKIISTLAGNLSLFVKPTLHYTDLAISDP
jgi:hypothetical protein